MNERKRLEERYENLMQELNERNDEIEMLYDKFNGWKSKMGQLSDIASVELSSCLAEMKDGQYILTGRLEDNLMKALKSKKIITYDQEAFIWSIVDLEKFVRRIEYRVKRNLDAGVMYSYKTAQEFVYDVRLKKRLREFDKVLSELEWLEKKIEGRETEPLFRYTTEEVANYHDYSKEIQRIEGELVELRDFVEKNRNMPPAIFKVLGEHQINLLREQSENKERLEKLRRRYK